VFLDTYGYAKTTDSLYDTMQQFLKGMHEAPFPRKWIRNEICCMLARWHIALVQEPLSENTNVETHDATVGVITLEDVIEEMLQREIIEETDLYSNLVTFLEKR
jgi:hypothetical protein